MTSELQRELSAILRRPGEIKAEDAESKAWLLVSVALEKFGGKRVSLADAKLEPWISDEAAMLARYWASQVARGVPLQYATGRADFLDHVYEIGKGVLIPRPETELVAQEAAKRLAEPVRGFEWGVGSGVLSIELLSRFPGLSMHAIDIAPQAIDATQKNAARILGASASRLTVSRDWTPADRELDFIISNPPYLDPRNAGEVEATVVQYEPHLALFAPMGDLLTHYRHLETEGQARLRRGGSLFLEVPHERAGEIRKLFSDKVWANVEVVPDLTGRPRMLAARLH